MLDGIHKLEERRDKLQKLIEQNKRRFLFSKNWKPIDYGWYKRIGTQSFICDDINNAIELESRWKNN